MVFCCPYYQSDEEGLSGWEGGELWASPGVQESCLGEILEATNHELSAL
jgi:hypothetical protein